MNHFMSSRNRCAMDRCVFCGISIVLGTTSQMRKYDYQMPNGITMERNNKNKNKSKEKDFENANKKYIMT